MYIHEWVPGPNRSTNRRAPSLVKFPTPRTASALEVYMKRSEWVRAGPRVSMGDAWVSRGVPWRSHSVLGLFLWCQALL